MGSSSVSCVLTGATLANESAVLIPLAPAISGDRRRPCFDLGSRVISNEGACAILAPLTLPIFGVVGDYGEMEEYTRDANTEYLTRKMGGEKNFRDFLEAVAHGGTTPYTVKLAAKSRKHRLSHCASWDGGLRGCWVAKEAWDKFSSQVLDESGENITSSYVGSWVTGQVLKGMGFLKGKQDSSLAISIFGSGVHDGDRYNIPYTHPELPDLTVWYDGYMSSKASYRGKKVDLGYHVKDLCALVKKLGMTFPSQALVWAKSHTFYYPILLELKSKRAKEIRLNRLLEEGMQRNPTLGWEQILDNFTKETKAELHRRFQAFLDHLKDKSVPFKRLDQNLGPEFQIPYIRTFCNRSLTGGSKRKGIFHVTTTTSTLEGDPTEFTITKCDCTDSDVTNRDHYLGHKAPFRFSDDVLEALKQQGYKSKVRSRMPDRYGYDEVHLRGFAREMAYIYHGKVLSQDFLPMLEALLLFDFSMGACNRLFQPTNSGWQCGNLPMQREVAKMSWKLASDKITKRKSWR